MPIVALSVMEAELFSAVLCAQDMLFAMRILNSLGLKVKLPMKLEIDNKGAVDFNHNYSVGGRTRHVEVKQYFLRELKEAGLIICEWCSGKDMSSDILTKNCSGVLFEKHIRKFVGCDAYMEDANAVMETGTHKGRVSEIGCESRRESRKIEYYTEDDRTGSSVIEEDGMTQVGAVDFLRDEG
jgi:hypothetical protein